MPSGMQKAAAAARSGLDKAQDAVLTDTDRPSFWSEEPRANRAVMNEVRMIGGALVGVLIVALVLTEVHDAVAIEEGPFAEISTAAESTGVAAITLLIVGLLVLAASVIMRFMGGGFGGR